MWRHGYERARRLGVFLDSLAISFSWMISYVIRFVLLGGFSLFRDPSYLMTLPLIVGLTLFFYHKNRLYTHNFSTPWYREVLSVLWSHIESFCLLVVVLYFVRSDKLSRVGLTIYFAIALLLMLLSRSIARNYYSRKQSGRRRFLLVGHGAHAREYVVRSQTLREAGVELVGWIDSQGMAEEFDLPETSDSLESLLGQQEIEGVVICYPLEEGEKQKEALTTSRPFPVHTILLPDLSYAFIGSAIVDFLGIPMITIDHPRINSLELVLKRLIDIVGAVVGLILFSPLLALIALAIKLSSKGPILYGQERMSLLGRRFTMWKFRSMYQEVEEKSGAVWATKGDPRTTPLGRLLRRTSLDELPQLWNVLAGEISLVGPRPERPVFVEKFRQEIPDYILRLKVKGGLTGWAQINGWRGNTDLKKRIEFDIYYIKNWSLGFDFKIVFLTFIRGFINKNAY